MTNFNIEQLIAAFKTSMQLVASEYRSTFPIQSVEDHVQKFRSLMMEIEKKSNEHIEASIMVHLIDDKLNPERMNVKERTSEILKTIQGGAPALKEYKESMIKENEEEYSELIADVQSDMNELNRLKENLIEMENEIRSKQEKLDLHYEKGKKLKNLFVALD